VQQVDIKTAHGYPFIMPLDTISYSRFTDVLAGRTMQPHLFKEEAIVPGIFLRISGSPDQQLARSLAAELTSLTCELLDKAPEKTMVIVQRVAHGDWFINRQSLAELGKNSFRLEVTITDETSTKQQKAAYQKAAFDLLSRLIGNVHPHSNVHVIDCRASAYGYGGVTQEYRHQHPGSQQAVEIRS
jgi:4-oxalocrotonate tautomerase